jgi:hypothetical protein
MTRRTIIGAALACIICCLPVILATAGVTTGVAGAVGYLVGHYEGLIIAAVGLAYLVAVMVRHVMGTSDVRLVTPARETPS